MVRIMFFKKNLFFIYTALFILYLIFIILAFLNIESFYTVSSDSKLLPTVIIDAGHGGEDGGAVANNVIEKDLNLNIAKKLGCLLKTSGFKVKLTRNSDKMINSTGSSLRERKVSDMKNRLKIFNGGENNVVISIHQNKFELEKYNGTQVFYSVNNEKSKLLAEEIKTSVNKLIQPYNNREVKPADRNIYLLYNSRVPSVIVECGFISNYEEAERLKDNEYRNKLVFSIYSGFMNFYNNR